MYKYSKTAVNKYSTGDVNRRTFEKLSGLNGYVYLMFCGGENYAEAIGKRFVEYGIVKYKESVNQAMKRLIEGGLLIFRKQAKTRGRTKYYTANLSVLQQAIKIGFFPPYDAEPLPESFYKEFHPFISEYFPRYIQKEKEYLKYNIQYRSWLENIRSFVAFEFLILWDFILENLTKKSPFGKRVLKIMRAIPFAVPLFFEPRKNHTKKRVKGIYILRNTIFENMTETQKKAFRKFAKEYVESTLTFSPKQYFNEE